MVVTSCFQQDQSDVMGAAHGTRCQYSARRLNMSLDSFTRSDCMTWTMLIAHAVEWITTVSHGEYRLFPWRAIWQLFRQTRLLASETFANPSTFSWWWACTKNAIVIKQPQTEYRVTDTVHDQKVLVSTKIVRANDTKWRGIRLSEQLERKARDTSQTQLV